MKKHWHITFRDLFLGTLALIILYDQVFIARAAQPLLIFLVIFLFASIPALRGDSKDDQYGPFARFVMMALGIEVPQPPDERGRSGTGSSSATQTSSGSEQSVDSEQSSPR
jgi:hypothetical protein